MTVRFYYLRKEIHMYSVYSFKFARNNGAVHSLSLLATHSSNNALFHIRMLFGL